jgi:hypothetical protein
MSTDQTAQACGSSGASRWRGWTKLQIAQHGGDVKSSHPRVDAINKTASVHVEEYWVSLAKTCVALNN